MSDTLLIAPPDPQTDREAIFELTAKTFAGEGLGYWGWIDHCRAGYIDHSPYDWSASSIGRLGGRLLTHWGVWGYRMRIGSATIRVAGIGAVATHARYRSRGFMARTAQTGLRRIRGRGYDMSILFGRPDFYERFGYVRAWSEQTHIVKVSDLPDKPPAARPRKFALRHRDDLAKLYNRAHARLTGTAVRPTYSRCRYHDHWDGYLWTDADGRATGYIIVAEFQGRFEMIDCVGDDEQVLRVIARQAGRRGYDTVHFPSLHHEHPLARRLRWGDSRVETRHRHSGGAMVRTVNLPATLKRLAPELSRRLKRSPLRNWQGTVRVANARETSDLAIDRGRVRLADPAGRTGHAIRGGDEIAQLLIGTATPPEIVEQAGTRITGDARRLLPTLFPAQHPLLGEWDHF